jgi:hypothetical protein
MIKFVDLKYTYSDLDVCYFYVAQNTNYLNKKKLHVGGINS